MLRAPSLETEVAGSILNLAIFRCLVLLNIIFSESWFSHMEITAFLKQPLKD